MACFDTVDRLMRSAVAQRIFPGAVLWVAFDKKVRYHKSFGYADLFRRQPMTRDTVFDLASLTKPLATTPAVMDLVHQGLLELDAFLGDRWPGWTPDKRSITIRHLLSHRSGLPPWQPYFMQLRHLPHRERGAAMRMRLKRESLQSRPGERCVYSDLGFMLLQWIVESVVGQRLDAYVAEKIFRPLGISPLLFVDLGREKPRLSYAATELCPWRKKLLNGEVHDDNAYVLGGVAGHAGLFGTAASVGALLLAFQSPEEIQDRPAWLDRSVLDHFFRRQMGGTFALGFDTPSERGSSAGIYFSEHSVGHLGFTGTSFWMDLRQGIIVVLLTNRVHPSRYDERIREFRPDLHNTVIKALRT